MIADELRPRSREFTRPCVALSQNVSQTWSDRHRRNISENHETKLLIDERVQLMKQEDGKRLITKGTRVKGTP